MPNRKELRVAGSGTETGGVTGGVVGGITGGTPLIILLLKAREYPGFAAKKIGSISKNGSAKAFAVPNPG